jgi:prepilin-type processing-associated H-X9-DG protein
VIVAKMREAALRTRCTNNLRVMGLSLHHYHSSREQFPLAGLPNAALPPEKRLSWIVATVPFVESYNPYARMDPGKGWEAEENRWAAGLRMRYLQCPAYPEHTPESTVLPSHYDGIAGLGPDAALLPAKGARAGFFGYERKLRLEDLQGRADAVLAVIETSHASGAWTAAGPATVRDIEEGAAPQLGPEAPFGGNHRGGAQALFADGSVRFLDAGIAPSVLEGMATVKER